jgi:hypothetical protein
MGDGLEGVDAGSTGLIPFFAVKTCRRTIRRMPTTRSESNLRKIPPFQLVPRPLNAEAEALPPFEWAEPVIGTRHRLGGDPEFIQREKIPQCSCNQHMTFYAQLDSINDEFCLADAGMIYVFVCFDCFDTKSILHSY